jgi:hypothetical protein
MIMQGFSNSPFLLTRDLGRVSGEPDKLWTANWYFFISFFSASAGYISLKWICYKGWQNINKKYLQLVRYFDDDPKINGRVQFLALDELC